MKKINFNNQRVSVNFGLTETLPNPFQGLKSPHYKEDELSRLITSFENSTHKNAAPILNLLQALQRFLQATTQVIYFKEGREKAANKNPGDLLSRLNPIGNAIIKFENVCTHAQQNNDPTYAILLEAKKYCIQSVITQLNVLKQSQDEIFNVYLKNDNPLKQVLSSQNDPSCGSRGPVV
ncbi:MAG: hypothetical protein A3F42_01135 [Gammaproteobacteria bacterium RIFCSPHIGHO2_12_FULL_37_34]|nr:MAG: hypothetical protein A3F42_01135 [Gammaproteobacteria bacterium RIFCSPHIGHO2_12_FULL_37_34]